MKKLMQLLLLLCLATVPATAQTEKSHVLIYMLDGKVDTLLLNNVRDIYHSRRDANGVEQTDVSTLRLRTVGGERVYPLKEIDHVVMPKSRRVVSFKGTALPDSETAGARQLTSVDGKFPGTAGDKVVYKWVANGNNYDYIFLANGQKSRQVGSPSWNRPNGEFVFESDTLVADEYTVYYSGSNNSSYPDDYNKVRILDVQTQAEPNNSDHLGTSGDCGWAVATRQPNSDYLFQLNHEVAVLCFIPRVDSLKTIVLKDIAVKSADGKLLAGDYTLSTTGITLDSDTGKDTIRLELGGRNYANPFHVPNNKEMPEGAEWEHTPQDSVAAYMVVAPQAGSTQLKVYYHIYDTESQIDTVEMKMLTASEIAKATVYPITNKLNPRLFFAAFTDSCQWAFGEPARVFGSVNLPIENHGFIWGFNKNLDFSTKEGDLPSTTLTDFPELSFNDVAVSEVKQKAYYYRAYAKKDDQTWFGKIKKFGMDREIINMGTSVRWSSINMGAVTAEDPGDQYAWGEKTTKTDYSVGTYQHYENNIGDNIAGNPEYDVVTATWRGCWRMPTKAEMLELAANCLASWKDSIDEDDVSHRGLLFINKSNPDSVIFLPADGYRNSTGRYSTDHCYYQTGTLYPSDSRYNLYQYDNSQSDHTAWRWEGLSIRPVFESNIESEDGKYFFIRTDSISYSADHTSTNMYGTMRGIDDVVPATDVTQGFVIGTADDVELGSNEVLKVTLTQTAIDNGSYHLPLTKEQMDELDFGTKYYVRSYMIYGTNTWYGDPLEMLAMTITTDSTNWAVGMTSARLCGTVTGITESVKESTELGFVVGTTADVTLGTEGHIEIACDSTVNNKFVCDFNEIEFKQYYYRAFVRQGGRVAYGDPRMLGLEFVDLGLPSGLKWANINVGSQTPMDNGNPYSWGETITKTNFSNNVDNRSFGEDIGGSLHDAAQVNWQGPWRMPSKTEVEELIANCTWQKITLYGKDGHLLTSRINGRTIFIPFTGFWWNGSYHYDDTWRYLLWTSTWSSDNRAWYFDNYPSNDPRPKMEHNDVHGYGFFVRPVALVNDTLDDKSMIQLTTDSVHWEVGHTSATLYGYLLGLRYNSKATESGFAYATTPNVTDETPDVNYLKTNEGELYSVSSGVFQATVPDVEDNTVYYYRAYVKVDGKYYFANEREFGRRMVDLGLPSHTLWANINLGASSSDDSGDYYAWGETATKSVFSSNNYTCQTSVTDIAGSNIDAAHVNWGGLWRMPTRDDVSELLSCTWTEVTKYGRPMYKVVGPSGDSIFIAKRGSMSGSSVANDGMRASFWTSNLNVSDGYAKDNAYGTSFYGSNRAVDAVARYMGYTVRPIVKYTHELADQTKIYLTTDSTDWYVGNANPRLVGAVAGLDGVSGDVALGFVVGCDSTASVLKFGGQGVTPVSATKSETDNTFRANMAYDKDTTYYYRAYVKVGDEYYYGNVRRYGLELVDMGNNLIWASLNLGSQISSDFGERYAWGETTANKSSYTQGTYAWYDNGYTNIGVNISKTNRDAAKSQWGGKWRMPTTLEMNWLVNPDNCTWEWTTEDGVSGYRVTSKVEGHEGKSIFLPAAGYQEYSFYKSLGTDCYYWTASSYNDNLSYYLHGDAASVNASEGYERFYGLLIRPVKSSDSIEGSSEGITGQHKPGGVQTGGNGGNGSGNAGSGNTGTTIGN